MAEHFPVAYSFNTIIFNDANYFHSDCILFIPKLLQFGILFSNKLSKGVLSNVDEEYTKLDGIYWLVIKVVQFRFISYELPMSWHLQNDLRHFYKIH